MMPAGARVEETALLTEYARALDSSMLGDILADEIVGKIEYDFTGLGVIPPRCV